MHFIRSRLIMVTIQAAIRQCGVNFVGRLYLVGIVAGSSNELMDLFYCDDGRIVDDGEVLRSDIPHGLLNTFVVQCRFDTFLAHCAIAIDFEMGCDDAGFFIGGQRGN